MGPLKGLHKLQVSFARTFIFWHFSQRQWHKCKNCQKVIAAWPKKQQVEYINPNEGPLLSGQFQQENYLFWSFSTRGTCSQINFNKPNFLSHPNFNKKNFFHDQFPKAELWPFSAEVCTLTNFNTWRFPGHHFYPHPRQKLVKTQLTFSPEGWPFPAASAPFWALGGPPCGGSLCRTPSGPVLASWCAWGNTPVGQHLPSKLTLDSSD